MRTASAPRMVTPPEARVAAMAAAMTMRWSLAPSTVPPERDPPVTVRLTGPDRTETPRAESMAAVAWVKVLYPRLSRLVDRFINWKHKTFVTVVTVLMVADIVISLAALWRYGERQAGDAPDNAVERFLDEHYDDEFMEHRYQNMRLPEDSGS